MLIYLPKHNNRSQFLVAHSIFKEYGGSLKVFASQDIYEISLNTQESVVVVLNEFNLNDMFISNFMGDFLNYSKSHKTKIVILSEDKKYRHNSISYIPPTSFKPFNEYYEPDTTTENKKFILCHLDCNNHKNNDRLKDIIYPNNKTRPVKLVGCPNIQHPQNLGLVDEDQMIRLIKECAIYIDISHQYFYDAIWHNKPTISIHDNEFYEPLINIQMSEIEQIISTHNLLEHDLKKQRISNMVKYIVKL